MRRIDDDLEDEYRRRRGGRRWSILTGIAAKASIAGAGRTDVDTMLKVPASISPADAYDYALGATCPPFICGTSAPGYDLEILLVFWGLLCCDAPGSLGLPPF
jgi:hypothetical protein